MKKIFILLSLITTSLFASYTNTGFDIGVKQGYRNDKIRIKTINITDDFPKVPVYDSEYKNLKSYLTSVFINTRYKGFCVNGIINYGWILSGKGFLNLPVPIPGNPWFPKAIYSKIRGNVSDLIANFGYGIDLFHSRFVIVPQIGYGQYKQNIKRKNLSPTDFHSTTFGPFTALLQFQVDARHNTFKLKWHGPQYGGDLLLGITKNIELEVGYFYHYLSCRLMDKFIAYLSGDIPGFGVLLNEFNYENVSMKKKGAFGHQIKARLGYSFYDHWKIAIFGEYYYFKLKKGTLFGDEFKRIWVGTPSIENSLFVTEGFTKTRFYSTAFELSYLF